MLQLLHREQKEAIRDYLKDRQNNSYFRCTLPFAPHNFNASLAFYKHNPETLHFLIEAEDPNNGKQIYIAISLPFEQALIGMTKFSFDAEPDEATVILFTSISIHAGRGGFISSKYDNATRNLTGEFEFIDHLGLIFKGEYNIYRAN